MADEDESRMIRVRLTEVGPPAQPNDQPSPLVVINDATQAMIA
jgi:hypothetical protein